MIILSNKNVYEAALDRIRYIFDEFKNVTVQHSGGKDSTVIFNLAMKIAKEKNRLPLHVLFVDQEAEWTETINMINEIKSTKDVILHWYQMPIRIDNATSYIENHLYCWKEGEEWLRDKDKDSIKVNNYGCETWTGLFKAILEKDFPDSHCTLTGIRAEESPRRRMGLTQGITYKWVTWGNKTAGNNNHFAFHPIYDWSYTDVWKAIHDEGWSYCKIYDRMYQYGVPTRAMRVSNLHHETAVSHLFYLQQFDGELYNKLVKRLGGIDTAGKMGSEDFFIKHLPYMFKDWEEYLLHLIDKLVDNDKWEHSLRKFIEDNRRVYHDDNKQFLSACKAAANSVLSNDTATTKLRNYASIYTGFKKRNDKREKAMADDNNTD